MSSQKPTQDDSEAFECAGGEVRVWLEQEAMHIVAFEPHSHDPVELTADEAKRLAIALMKMAEKLDD